MLYREKEDAGNIYRGRQLNELECLIKEKRKASSEKRKEFFVPNFDSISAYRKSTEKYREQLCNMLGWPLNNQCKSDAATLKAAEYIEVAQDDLGTIYRVELDAGLSLTTYGLLFIPQGNGPFPLAIAQHGGLGTPESISDFFGSGNYNNMLRRVLVHNIAVFAPQLLLWNVECFGNKYDRPKINGQLKQLGSSIAAVEIYKLQKSIDHLTQRKDINGDRIGMAGLSYGGFYTLFTAAVEERIKVAVCSGFLNNRFTYDWNDFSWFNSGNTFLDAEIAMMICPRPLYVELGDKDELFTTSGFFEASESINEVYVRLNIAEKFLSVVFDGIHEFNPNDTPIDFLLKHL